RVETFRDEMALADKSAARAINLAKAGIPEEGAVYLLRRDPLTQGPALFRQNCAVCHTYGTEMPSDKATASDLAGFGTADWNYRLLLDPGHKDFFGRTNLTGMVDFITNTYPNLILPPGEEAKLSPGDKEKLEKDRSQLKQIARWLTLHPRKISPERDSEDFKQ